MCTTHHVYINKYVGTTVTNRSTYRTTTTSEVVMTISLESQNLFCIHSINLCPCQIWVAMFLDFLNFLIYRLATQLKNRIKVIKSACFNY